MIYSGLVGRARHRPTIAKATVSLSKEDEDNIVKLWNLPKVQVLYPK